MPVIQSKSSRATADAPERLSMAVRGGARLRWPDPPSFGAAGRERLVLGPHADDLGQVRLQLLGPLRAWRDETELDLGPRQQQYLLALLLARVGRPTSVSELIDLLWDDDVPRSAINILQKYVGVILTPARTCTCRARIRNLRPAPRRRVHPVCRPGRHRPGRLPPARRAGAGPRRRREAGRSLGRLRPRTGAVARPGR